MPDLTEFEQLNSSNRSRVPCAIAVPLEALDDEQREQLEAALAAGNDTIGAGAIVKWLERRGFKVTINRVTAHRRGQCRCSDD